MEEAVAIGYRLVDEAFVHGDRCNWLVRQIVYPKGFEPKDRPTIKPLGPNVYDGTAGVALLLARLAVIGDSPKLGVTAAKALNHALRHDWDREDPRRRFGFYSGLTGVAWACHELSFRLERSDLVRSRDRLIRHLLARDREGVFQDVIFGAGGAIPVLCRMHEDDPSAVSALELAESMAKRLIATAEWVDDAASWNGARPQGKHTPNLNGLSHGSSGIAWGLAHYGRYHGDKEAVDTALGALRYDDASFVEDAGNWRDLRNDFNPDRPLPVKFASVWCHGAPGIGISRLPFVTMDDAGQPLRRDLQAASERTRETLAKWWLNPGSDTCVCHGVTGNAEALSLMEHALGEDGTTTMREWAGWLVHRYGKVAGAEWPTAVTVGQHPGLMTGVGSAAHFLLRACDEEVLDPLVLPPSPAGEFH